MQAALVSRKWTDRMIDEFIENFRQKHGFNRHTAMLPYYDEGDSDDEPIELEGGRKIVIRRCIISPDEATTQEEDPDKLEDLGARPKKRPAPKPDGEKVDPWSHHPGRNTRGQSRQRPRNPRKTPSRSSPRRGRKAKRQLRRLIRAKCCRRRSEIQHQAMLLGQCQPQDRVMQTP